MNDATVHTTGARPVIRFERHLAEPPTEVWRALTDRAQLRAWFPTDIITNEWKVGAALTFVFRDNEAADLTGRVLELDEPHVLAYTWGEETLRFELHPDDDGGTRLVLTDELDRPFAARNAAGWEVCLEQLAGRGEGGPWRPRFERYVAAFEAELGAQEGPPPGFEG